MITDVGSVSDADQRQIWSNFLSATGGFGTGGEATLAFDGATTSTWAYANTTYLTDPTTNITFDASTLSLSGTLEVYFVITSGTTRVTLTKSDNSTEVKTFVSGGTGVADFGNVTAGIKTIKVDWLTASDSFQPNLSAIKVNGKWLVDQGAPNSFPTFTTLTLTDDTDLTEFPVGQTVTQSGGNTPVSSAITGVTDTFIPGASYNNSGFFRDLGTFWADAASSLDNLSRPGTTVEMTGGKLYVKSGDVIGIKCGTDQPDGCPLTINIALNSDDSVTVYSSGTSPYLGNNNAGSYASYSLQSFTYTGEPGYVKSWLFGGSSANAAGQSGFYKNGTKVTGNSQIPFIELTLTDDTNLANFRVGDVLQEEGSPTTALVYAQANDEAQGSYFNYFKDSFQFSGWTILDILDETLIGTTFTYSLFYNANAGAGWVTTWKLQLNRTTRFNIRRQ